ncbi:MAG: maltotransferase domain-containing protein [Candidatus Bipolaricaulia bacterium]
MPMSKPSRRRVAIEGVHPEINGGRFPIKRTVGERVVVEADVFADGHDVLAGVLLYRPAGQSDWHRSTLQPLGNDRWRGEFRVAELGPYVYTLEAWVDRFATWQRDLAKKADADQDVRVDLLVGAQLVETAAGRADGGDQRSLTDWATKLRDDATSPAERVAAALDDELHALMSRCAGPTAATRYPRELTVVVDRERARFSAWYEMFPRSCASEPGQHGTFADCEARLPYIAEMGFDVLYLPPIHPIGTTHRKGPNNAPEAGPSDPGSPWAIGSSEGGHKAVHPDLGTVEDFRRFVDRANDYGLEVALDVAFQCSPDHPWVSEHPEWFCTRPDGTIQHAENPPKKYEDIYPLNFETEDWANLWRELKRVFEFWIEQGIKIFRVDNPHTKPFPFWEWLIDELKSDHPDLILLAEAFTRPKVMYRLAKLGFTQSYTYFAWRNTREELERYFHELTQTEVREFFRPNLWPNTPDILTEYLQNGGRPAFVARLVLAATLGASYGIYGPPFELGENVPREPGSEEYRHSEKYEIRDWDLDAPHSLRPLIARINEIRRANAALQSNHSLRFHPVDNDQLVCYSKQSDDGANTIIVAVNLDPHHTQAGMVDLSLDELGIDGEEPYQVHDLLGEARYTWQGSPNYVELDPNVVPAHVFRVRHRARSEADFEYYV